MKSPAGFEKMSDMLSEYAEPFFDGADTFEEQKKSIAFAGLVWNLSLMPETERESAFLEGPISELPTEVRPFIEKMVRRKHDLFPDVNRIIVDYELTQTGSGLRLNVVSTLPMSAHDKT